MKKLNKFFIITENSNFPNFRRFLKGIYCGLGIKKSWTVMKIGKKYK